MGNKGRSHFTVLPNMIDDLKLSVHGFRLYVHIARVAGSNGRKCTQGTRLMSDICNMSMASVSKAKRELLAAGLITIKNVMTPNGKEGHEITLIDVWDANESVYQLKGSEDSPDSSHSERSSSPGEHHSSRDERRKELPKNDKVARQAALVARARSFFQKAKHRERRTLITDKFEITPEMEEWAMRNYPDLDVEFETEEFISIMQSQGRKSSNWQGDWYGFMRSRGELRK